MKLEPIPYARPSGWSPIEKNQRTWLIAFGIISVLLGIGTTVATIFVGEGLYLELDSGKININLSDTVQRTLELYSGARGWSERCPMPVFFACTILALFGFTMLLHAVDRKAPAFGAWLTGSAAMATKLIWGGIILISALAMWRLWKWGWWLATL